MVTCVTSSRQRVINTQRVAPDQNNSLSVNNGWHWSSLVNSPASSTQRNITSKGFRIAHQASLVSFPGSPLHAVKSTLCLRTRVPNLTAWERGYPNLTAWEWGYPNLSAHTTMRLLSLEWVQHITDVTFGLSQKITSPTALVVLQTLASFSLWLFQYA